MILIHTLRMIVDLSIYFYFAELAAALTGGKSMLFEMLLLCIYFGVLVWVQKFSQNRFFLLLPVCILFLPKTLGITIANRVLLAPPIIYMIYLFLKEEYGLSWDRQYDLFSASWKIFLAAGTCICLSGNYTLCFTYSIPVAFISLFSSILLLRMLRHESEVYLSRQYQFRNILLLGFILLLSWLSSRKAVLDTALEFFRFMYKICVLPILTIFITGIVAVTEFFINIFSWIKLGEITFSDNQMSPSEGMNVFSDLDQTAAANGNMFKIVLGIIIVLLLAVAAFFFFHWLSSNREKERTNLQSATIIRSSEPDLPKDKRESTAATNLQVRRQYRKFLKLYKLRGEQISLSDTSQDVAKKSRDIFGAPDEINEIREIYIRARYGNQATRSDLKRIKQINQMLK